MRPTFPGSVFLLAACALLGGCGDGEPPAPRVDGRTQSAWEEQAESFDARARAEAFEALARFATPPVDKIAAGLDDKRIRARLAAIQALGTVGVAAAKHVGRLASYLEEDPEGFEEDEARQLRDGAMLALGQMGTPAFKSIAHLLVSRDARLRARAAFTIRPLVAGLEDGVSVLLPLAKDESWVVRREAVRGLGLAGKGDARAAEALLAALEDENTQVVQQAAMSIGGIGGRSDHEGRALAGLLMSHQTPLRAAAAYGLGLMGVEASPYARRLADLTTNDSRQVVRIQAALAHWRIVGEEQVAFPVLEKGVTCEDKGLCRDALKAVAEVGPPAAPLVPHLVPLLEDAGLRAHAAAALGAIGSAAQAAVPALSAALAADAGRDEEFGREGRLALARIGAP